MLADLETVTRARDKAEKLRARRRQGSEGVAGRRRQAAARTSNAGQARVHGAALVRGREGDRRRFFLLTIKPILFACNVAEGELATAETTSPARGGRPQVSPRRTSAPRPSSSPRRSSASSPSCRTRRRASTSSHLGVADSGVSSLIRAAYHLLGLRTYLTAGEKEARAWTIHAGDTAPQAAGVIHSDFEKGFIKAETVSYDDLVAAGSMAAAREKGLVRQEGRDYVVRDGDVMLFKFNV